MPSIISPVTGGTNKFSFIYQDPTIRNSLRYTAINRSTYVYNPLTPAYMINVSSQEYVLSVLLQLENYRIDPSSIRVLSRTGAVMSPSVYGIAFIGTNVTLQLLDDNGTVIDEAIVVVRGDTNGDGKIDDTDRNAILFHLLGVSALTGAWFIAADTNRDGKIDDTDNNGILFQLMGVQSMHEGLKVIPIPAGESGNAPSPVAKSESSIDSALNNNGNTNTSQSPITPNHQTPTTNNFQPQTTNNTNTQTLTIAIAISTAIAGLGAILFVGLRRRKIRD